MPPLQLNDDEMNLLLVLAAPIDQRLRHEFLAAVAAELEAGGQAGAVGIGSVHRIGRVVQRRYFDPPQLPNAGKMATRLKAKFKAGTSRVRSRLSARRASWLFSPASVEVK
jgi:hypothetical protein